MTDNEKNALHHVAMAQMLIGLVRVSADECAALAPRKEEKHAFKFAVDSLEMALQNLYEAGVFNTDTEQQVVQCFEEYNNSLEKGGNDDNA